MAGSRASSSGCRPRARRIPRSRSPEASSPRTSHPDGALLAKRVNYRREIVGVAAGDTRERNLTWLDWSFPDDISDDGRTLLFDEQSAGGRTISVICARPTAPRQFSSRSRRAMRSRPTAAGLSPRVSTRTNSLWCRPGRKHRRCSPRPDLIYQWGYFFPDGKRILLWANEPGREHPLLRPGDRGRKAATHHAGGIRSVFRRAGDQSGRRSGRGNRARPQSRGLSRRRRAAAAASRNDRGRDGLGVDRRQPLALRREDRDAGTRRNLRSSRPGRAGSGRRSCRPIRRASSRSARSKSRRTASPTSIPIGAHWTTCSWSRD